MALYSIKMRSSKGDIHISGAERIINKENLECSVDLLLKRALNHSKGSADFVNIKIEEIEENEIIYINPLLVTTVEVKDYTEGLKAVEFMLGKLGIEDNKAHSIVELFKNTTNMRGAILLDINTMERLEPDKERGIRATYMDFENTRLDNLDKNKEYKSHFIEALALASKVINCPYIVGEICYSDDPNYTAGYIASKKYGYIRFTHLKKLGDLNGGRIFLYDSSKGNLRKCIDYIENTKVLIKNNIMFNENISYKELIFEWI